MEIKVVKDKDFIVEALQKGRISCDTEGKVKITHTLANNISTTLILDVLDINISIKE